MTKRTGTKYESKLKEILERRGWLAIRAAGSHGIDVVAVRPEITILFEVKSTREKEFRLNGQGYEQYRRIRGLIREGYVVLYAIRHIGTGEWYIFTPDDDKPGVIHLEELPHLESVLQMYESGVM